MNRGGPVGACVLGNLPKDRRGGPGRCPVGLFGMEPARENRETPSDRGRRDCGIRPVAGRDTRSSRRALGKGSKIRASANPASRPLSRRPWGRLDRGPDETCGSWRVSETGLRTRTRFQSRAASTPKTGTDGYVAEIVARFFTRGAGTRRGTWSGGRWRTRRSGPGRVGDRRCRRLGAGRGSTSGR